jgi:hypothetical protein
MNQVAAIVKDIPGENHPQLIALYSTLEKAQSEFDKYFSDLDGYRVTEFIVR